MDFTTDANSALVGYDLVPVVGLQDLYSPELVGSAQWAEPRLAGAGASRVNQESGDGTDPPIRGGPWCSRRPASSRISASSGTCATGCADSCLGAVEVA